jgi:transposase
MRGNDQISASLISYVSPEERIGKDHQLRMVRQLVVGLLQSMDEEFSQLYPRVGRPSIPPERLLRALLLQIFYSVRSARMLIEQLDYNLLFRWFIGIEIDEPVWNHAVFSKNLEWLLNEEEAQQFLA